MGVLAAAGAMLAGLSPVAAVMTGWIMLAAVFLVWSGGALMRLDGAATRRRAAAEDPGPLGVDSAILGACAMSLIGVGALLFGGAGAVGAGRVGDAVVAMLVLLAVISAWAMMHFVFAVRYAAMYYRAEAVDGSWIIDFNGAGDPPFVDFLYFSGTIGVSYAVSDTDVSSSAMRSVLIVHAVLSFFLSTVVLASTVNLVLQMAGGE